MAKKQTSTSLAIGKKDAKLPLSKLQKEFNRLVRKTEKLRNDIVLERKKLDDLLQFYGNTLQPEEKEVREEQIKLIKLLHKLGRTYKLNQKQQKGLKINLDNLLQDILQIGGMPEDEDVKNIFKEINGKSIEEVRKEELDDLKEELSSFAEENGVDMDFDWLSADMKEEEMIQRLLEESQKMKEMSEKEEMEKAARKQKKPKTESQQAKEKRLKEAEELRNKNLSDIYKQLAKVLHPDMEPDVERKREKESLMKKLTVAYKQKDLHTLLSLELAWIHKEEDKLDELADDKLKSYNEMLKNQVQELEMELYQTQTHPRYEPLSAYSNLSYFGLKPQMRDLIREVETLKERKENIQGLCLDLCSSNEQTIFKKYLQSIYEDYMEEERYRMKSPKVEDLLDFRW